MGGGEGLNVRSNLLLGTVCRHGDRMPIAHTTLCACAFQIGRDSQTKICAAFTPMSGGRG